MSAIVAKYLMEMNERLREISATMNVNLDVSTWEGVQKAVRSGFAKRFFPVGTKFRDVGPLRNLTVAAHDYFKSENDENAYTMTLVGRVSDVTVPFDYPQALYFADKTLPAGTYSFNVQSKIGKWNVGSYNFVLTNPVPVSGQLFLQGTTSSDITSCKIISFVNRYPNSVIETVSIQAGYSGTNIGTLGIDQNYLTRLSLGSSNYMESNIRKFLNGTSGLDYWTFSTKYDRFGGDIVADGFTGPGFLSQTFFNNEDAINFLNVVGRVIVPCASNDVYESPDSKTKKGEKYITKDKVCLLSQKELFGNSDNSVEDDSSVLPLFNGSDGVDKTFGVSTSFPTRSIYKLSSNPISSPSAIHAITSSGTDVAQTANQEFELVVAMTIV